MVRLAPGQPFTTPVPELVIDGGMAPGTYRVQLVVRDSAGQESSPFTKVLRVLGTTFPPGPFPPVPPFPFQPLPPVPPVGP